MADSLLSASGHVTEIIILHSALKMRMHGVQAGKGNTTPRSQQRSASAISHRSETGTPTLESTPKKLAIRKPSGTPSKSPEKAERPASGRSLSSQHTASPKKAGALPINRPSEAGICLLYTSDAADE